MLQRQVQIDGTHDTVMHGVTTSKQAYIGAIQLNALAAVVLKARMTPEAFHLGLVHGRGVIHLQDATSAADQN